MKAIYNTILSLGLILAGQPRSLVLERQHLRRHVAILGGSGQGKSKLLEQIMRQLENQGEGFTLIDPHGDTAEVFVEYLALRDFDPSRLYYLKPGPDCCFSFDPFTGGPSQKSAGYEAWLTSTVDRCFRAFVRNLAAADQEMMKRLRRWFTNIAFVCGYKVNGKYPGLSKSLVLTDPDHPDFDEIIENFRAVAKSSYSRTILSDFDKLIGTKNHKQREQWVESTINLLRTIFSPLVLQIFDQQANSIDLREVIRKKGILLVNLRKGDYLSRDQGNVIGGIIINFLLNAAENLAEHTPPALRTEHMLLIDEAENFVGEDLRMGFAELRKYGLSLCVCVQNVSALAKGDLDLIAKVFSQCGVFLTFQQGHPDDVEFIAKKIGYGNLDMTPLMTEQSLPDGYLVVHTQSVSVGRNRSVSASESNSLTRTQSQTHQHHTAESIQRSVSTALSETHSEGRSTSVTDSSSQGRAVGSNWSDGWNETEQITSGSSSANAHGSSRSSTDAQSHQTAHGHSEKLHDQDSKSVSRNSGSGNTHSASNGQTDTVTNTRNSSESHARGKSGSAGGSETISSQNGQAVSNGTNAADSRGQTLTTGLSNGTTRGESDGVSDGKSVGTTNARATSDGVTITQSCNETPLAIQRKVIRPSGSLVVSVQDQLYAIMNRLASLPDRMVLVSVKGMRHPFLLKVHEVVDPYLQRKMHRCLAWRLDDVRILLEKVRGAHSFYFRPGEHDDECVPTIIPMTPPNDGDDDDDTATVIPIVRPRNPKPTPAALEASRML